MNSKRTLIIKTLLATAGLATAIPCLADRGDGWRGGGGEGWRGGGEWREGGGRGEWRDRGEWRGGEGWREGDGWRDRDIRYFDRGDLNIWRGGRWVNDMHDDQWGWWWVAGGMWYFYPQPVYPYPDPYTPPVVVQPNVAPAPVAPQTTTQVWYYCEANKGYYPYVSNCPSGWRTVTPTTTSVPPAPPNAPAQY